MRLQLENRNGTDLAGLYIHVPFCVRKCPYCDFYSATDLDSIEAFVQCLKREMGLVEAPSAKFDTIYMGGGTPSLLAPSQIEQILQAARMRFAFENETEVTLEANPGTVSCDALQVIVDHGVNRINLGIQSFDDEQLSLLGRLHSAEEGRKAIGFARRLPIDNIGLDLIYGIPGQSSEDWLKDLREAVGYEPEHLSCYMLTYEKGTQFHRWRSSGRLSPMDDGKARDLFRMTVDFLGESGYERYEISNFSRGSAFRSRHNQKYWRHVPYVGLGPSAHSFVEPTRWWNHANLKDYLQSLQRGVLPVLEIEDLSEGQLMLESVFLGLRTSDGINLSSFHSRYGVDFIEHFAPVLKRLEAQNLLHLLFLAADRCGLTSEGVMFADTISAMFADHVETEK